MARKNFLTSTPPFAVEQALSRLGANLRTARLRRNLTISQVATKIGTGSRAVMDAEKGRPGASAATYLALLWAYDLLESTGQLADPTLDAEGIARVDLRERARPRDREALDRDF